MEKDKENTPLLSKQPSTCILVLTAITLVLMAHASSIGSSVRYGFLVIACTKRGIPGSIYGLIETSKVIGYTFAFSTKCYTARWSSKWSPKWIIEGTMFTIVASLLVSGAVASFDSNFIFLALSIGMRIIQGYVCFYLHVAIVDLSHYFYLKDFDRINGLLQLGYFSGHGIGQWMGVMLYAKYGYFIPFLAAGATMIVLMLVSLAVLPSCPSYATIHSGEKNLELDDNSEDSSNTMTDDGISITWLVIAPFISTITVNSIYNVLQIVITPYLLDNFNIPLAVSGSVLTCASFGMAIGSVLSGMLTHAEIVSTTTQMLGGAMMVATGILLIFPDPSMTLLYSHPLISSYPAVLLASLGDPILTIPALRAMKEVQLVVKGSLSPRQTIRISEIWLVGSKCATYMGSLIAGVLSDHFEVYESAHILAGLCCISMFCSIGLKIFVLKANKDINAEEIVH